MMSRLRLIAVSASLAIGAAGAAFADYPFNDLVSMDFTYQTSQLQTEQGAQALYRTLHKAALNTCAGSGTAIPENIAVKAYSECIDGLVTAAVSEINAPKLSALHDQGLQLAMLDR